MTQIFNEYERQNTLNDLLDKLRKKAKQKHRAVVTNPATMRAIGVSLPVDNELEENENHD